MTNMHSPFNKAPQFENAALISSLNELIDQLKKPQVSIQDQLWTTQDIADYLKLAQYTVERRVVVQASFPDSTQPCATGERASKRWFAGEVITWTRQNRARLPEGRGRRRT
ncbi:hypothetical protein V0R55_12430 [Pseudomonas soli]|uniref:DNA-binding protein n=1 Tax=Pseudomonas soli TaxID=1306993 RepID=A0ABU7GPK4_9PSED|nr:hypothetical protein [Pseudomonas soli]MEE1880970.1 hypothetical protein [Pseudomonas soli]